METLVVVAQQDQFHSRNRGRNHGAFGSYHTRDFRDINCRTFQSGSGILPSPNKACSPPVSLELPSVSVSDIDLFAHVAKSAPPSPTRDHHKGSRREFVNSDDEFATKTLRRILNLDLADE
ncbi:hypothetical protein HanPI659440_Chr04g0171681 [Helianthus annuus]|nr:hypothetical protein HanPI659440_Chr04g0171681 [Helianthus annuus]